MPVTENDVFVCGTCGTEAIKTWPYVHCYKCGAREDRPDLGLTADGQVVSNGGAVFGGGTPDAGSVSNVPTSQGDQPSESFPPGWTKNEAGEWVQDDVPSDPVPPSPFNPFVGGSQ